MPFETASSTRAEARVLHALAAALEQGLPGWPGGDVLFLGARPGLRSPAGAVPSRVFAEQPWRPDAEALRREGATMLEADDARRFPAVLLLPPRQRDARRARFARALDACREGGWVVAAVANDEGAKSAERDFQALAGLDGSLSKHHCRAFWVRRDGARIDTDLLARWRAADAPRPILDGQFLSRPGVFAWDRVDPASALLAAQLPEDLSGDGADLGAGWGYLASEVLRRNPGVRALDLYEADARAVALARDNLQPLAREAVLGFHWHDVAAGLPRAYDFIVSNPPFHAQDRAGRPELGQRFIEAAAAALRPGGRLYLVANRHLPYEHALRGAFADVRVLAEAHGFKAILAVRGR